MKVGIIGMGFVGNALRAGLKDNVKVIEIDPKLNTNEKDLKIFEPNIIFICVPTPADSSGSQDLTILNSVFNEIKDMDSLVVLKSTVSPDNLISFKQKYNFVYNPEFLREKSAVEDFINGSLILIGGKNTLSKDLSRFYIEYTHCKSNEHFLTDIHTASLVKYSINSFLSTKVIFFNQLKNIFNEGNESETWENFIKLIGQDNRIGISHMDVPGHDGRKGFGGACFPKDSLELLKYSQRINKEFSLLKEVIKINNEIRSVYNEPTDRETEQNISFEKKKTED